MILRALIMSTVFVAILFGFHFFIFISAVRFFGITGHQPKIILATAMAGLTLIFILGLIFTHFLKGSFPHFLYNVGSVWIGIGANLLVLFALGWAAVFIAKIFNQAPSEKMIGIAVLIVAGLVSIYGLINAQNIKTKQLSVQIKNLPEFWKGKNIIQISDAHLGSIDGSKFLKKIVQQSNELRPSIVFITGDLFDGSSGHLEDFKPLLNEIRAPQGVYFITGNHEAYLGVEKVYDLLEQTHIKVLSDEAIEVNGLQILGVNYPDTGEKQNIVSIINSDPDFVRGKPTILLHHVPSDIKQAKELGVNLQLSGHTHKFQLFPFGYLTKLIYGKYAYGFYREGDFNIYTSVGAGTWGPPMRTGNHPEIVNITLE